MELSWLKDFVALSETGIFVRAAEKRNITQPAFTRRIKRLEYALGVDLVDRSVHPVTLTKAGETFLPTAQSMIYEWDRSRSELGRDGTKFDAINIATLQSLAVSYMPTLVKSLYPDGHSPPFKIIADNFAGCIEAIISGNADALVCYSHQEIQTGDHVLDGLSHPLGSDLLIPVSSMINDRAKYSLRDDTIPFLKYSNMSFLGRITNLMLNNARTDIPLTPIYEDSIGSALKSAALEGLGVAWLPMALVKSELESGILKNISQANPDFEIPIGITIYRGRRTTSRTVDRFWNTINL